MKSDIFIGYRREQEFDLTNLIYNRLKGDGYSSFFDLGSDSIENGYIESQIRSKIDECTDFIIIVDKHTFDRSKEDENERDWLKFELEYANSQGKHIIPIFKGIKKIRKRKLPEEIAFLSEIHGIKYDDEFFNSFYEKLKKNLRSIRSISAQENNNQEQNSKKEEQQDAEKSSESTQKDNFRTGPSYESYNFDNYKIFTRGKRIREFFWYIAGTDPDILRLCPSCYSVYAVIGALVCLTATLALLTGAYAIYSISEIWWFPLCFAPVYAFMIFSIDRSFVAGGGTSIIKVIVRFALAIVIGLVISAPIEILVFHGRIDEYVATNHSTAIKRIEQEKKELLDKQKDLKGELNNMDSLQKILDEAYLKAQNELGDEGAGVGKSKKAGKGLVYADREKEVEIAKNNASENNDRTSERRAQLNSELANIDTLLQLNYAQIKKIENNNDFITRYKGFTSLIDDEKDMLWVAWAIRILFIMFEIVPIVSKLLLSDDNQYEKLKKSIEETKTEQYETVIKDIYKRIFGPDFERYYNSKFESFSGYMQDEYRKAQLIYKSVDDLNHFSYNNGYK